MKKRSVKYLLLWSLSFFVILQGAAVFAASQPQTAAVPTMRFCAVSKAVVPSGRVFADGGSLSGAKALYDGDETTVFHEATTRTVTLDLGRLHMLAGVRFLPQEGETEHDIDRAQGMVFYASRDMRTFEKVGVAEPKDNLGYEPQWQEYLFDGAGEFRYVRAEIPAGANVAEIEWLSYPNWNYQKLKNGKTRWTMQMYAYEIAEDADARIWTAVYNRNGVLKALSVTEEAFRQGEERAVEVMVEVPNHRVGDSYRILVRDKKGTRLTANDLRYCYRQGESGFSMSNLFSDDMMLQADKPLTVWGTAPQGSSVTVSLTQQDADEDTVTAVADRNGAWKAEMGTFPQGGDYTLTVRCGGEQKRFEHLIFGDIWLCVGQSNMDYHLLGGEDTVRYLDSEEGRWDTSNPEIRILNLWIKGIGGAGAKVDNLPIGYVNPAWSPLNRESASYCSAVGYFFAQKIYQQSGTPMGIINAAVGDTEINRWIPYGTQAGSFTSTDGGLFYNRVLPFANLQIKGILMYQGEADEYRTHLQAQEYADAMSGLVDLYRSIWGEDLPFYWTQLTRYRADESEVREGQRLALEQIAVMENAGVVSLMDIYGEYQSGAGSCREDIHPHQKREVAERFAVYAMRDVYGSGGEIASGPVYRSKETVGSTLVLHFDANGDLTVLPKERYADKQGMAWIREHHADETQPQCFEVAGADGVFYPAEAELKGKSVVLHSEQVAEPLSARYAWGAYPEMPNLTDQSMIPSLSFLAK